MAHGGQAFRQAAATVIRADCAFGAFYRRLKSRLGPAQAVVATAHKIAQVVYHMLKFKFDYQAVSAQEYDQRFREREIRYLQRRAAKLGFTLSPSTTPVLAVSQQSPRLAGPAFNPQETGELVTSAAWYNL